MMKIVRFNINIIIDIKWNVRRRMKMFAFFMIKRRNENRLTMLSGEKAFNICLIQMRHRQLFLPFFCLWSKAFINIEYFIIIWRSYISLMGLKTRYNILCYVFRSALQMLLFFYVLVDWISFRLLLLHIF